MVATPNSVISVSIHATDSVMSCHLPWGMSVLSLVRKRGTQAMVSCTCHAGKPIEVTAYEAWGSHGGVWLAGVCAVDGSPRRDTPGMSSAWRTALMGTNW